MTFGKNMKIRITLGLLLCSGIATAADSDDMEARIRDLELKVRILQEHRLDREAEKAADARRLQTLEFATIHRGGDQLVLLLGAVKHVGLFPYRPGLRVGQLITAAGSFEDGASPRVRVTRANANGEQKQIAASFSGLSFSPKERDESLELAPGDIVFVPEKILSP
jgi:hypothetical protein